MVKMSSTGPPPQTSLAVNLGVSVKSLENMQGP